MAAQNITCAVLLRGGADVRQIITALRFGISKGDDHIAADDFGDDGIGHRAANGLQRAAAKDNGLQIWLNRDDFAQLFHDERIFQMPAAQAAMLLAKRRAKHAEILCQRFPDARDRDRRR